MNKLFFDIETLPAPDEQLDTLKILYNKKLEKNPTYKTSFDDYHRGTSFNGAFGKILCIGYTINNEKTDILYEEGNESAQIKKFWDIAKKIDLFVGHNIIEFDMRFIYQRSIMNGIKPSIEINFARYRNNPMFDTMKEWSKWSINNIGLEELALSMGVPTPKEGIDGSQVFDFYKAGKIKEILEYCKRDVETTRAVYKKMTFEK